MTMAGAIDSQRYMTDSTQALPEICRLPGCHEPFSSLSHLAGAVIFVFLGALLLRRGVGDRLRLTFLGIYATSCVLLFTMSGMYHMMAPGDLARQVFERLDHSAIFLLVAGTFTPIHGILFRGWLRWGPLLLIWSGAIAGVSLKMIYFQDLAEWLWLSLYLGLGWLGIFGAVLLARQYGLAFIKPILLGGVTYTFGGIMEFRGWPMLIPGWIHPHDVFHIAVLLGALFHWRFIWGIARIDRVATSQPEKGTEPLDLTNVKSFPTAVRAEMNKSALAPFDLEATKESNSESFRPRKRYKQPRPGMRSHGSLLDQFVSTST